MNSYKEFKRKLWLKFAFGLKDKKRIYPLIYRSYWHYLLTSNKSKSNNRLNENIYIGAIPNPGAGIGHQLANWIAGLWFSKLFKVNFFHSSFSNKKWDNFLDFGKNEETLYDLKNKKFKIRRLPLFNENISSEVKRIQNIITSYGNEKVAFILETDQFYKDQYGVIDIIKEKFNKSSSREGEELIYKEENFNIAIHVRRTVIIEDKVIEEDEEAKAKRWLSNDYYEKVLTKVLENLNVTKKIVIHIFSTAKADEFLEFSKYGEIVFCNDLNEYDSFLHLVKADLLITSKSSFSYKPALISDGVKVCPKNFWHGYPDSKDWILVENNGNFDVELLKK